jgi:hypothetical protein
MGERGWGWTASKIRQVQFIEWLVPLSSSATFAPVKPFYDAQHDSAALTIQVVHDELRELERQSLIYLAAGLGGIEGFDALATAQGRRLAEEIQARRADNRLRRAACRDAMVDWLSSQDASSLLRQPARDQILADPRYGTWLAEPFSEADLDATAAWLHRHGLVDGITVEECEGPVRLYLTDAGVACAEEFCSDTARFVAAQRPDGTGPSISRSSGAQIGSGNFQVNHFYDTPAWARDGRAPENESSPRLSQDNLHPSAIPAGPFPAQLTQRTVPLNNGLHAGTMLAIEVRAHQELTRVTVVMVDVAGPAGAATIPPPARLYWHPSRDISTTIAQGASSFVNIGRVGPMPPGAIMDTPDQDLPWSLQNGQWQVDLQLTAQSYPALHLTASFNVSPANGFPVQRIEWLTLTAI